MYVAAVFSMGQVATGNHHGDAYSHLDNECRNADDLLVSGHVNSDGSFTTEMQHPKKNLIVVRHAESENNAGFTPHLDSNLTVLGLKQGLKTSVYLRDLKLDRFQGYCSPFLRCLETASMIHEATGIPFNVNRDISEVTMDFPEFGVTIPCRCKSYPQFQWSVLEKEKELHFPKEPPKNFLKRLSQFLYSLPEENALIVTHGTCVMTLVEFALGARVEKIAEWDGSIPNASLSHVADGTLKCMGKSIE